MRQFRVTRVYVIEADDRQDLVNRLVLEQQHNWLRSYLDFESVREIVPAGWGSALKRQLTGKR